MLGRCAERASESFYIVQDYALAACFDVYNRRALKADALGDIALAQSQCLSDTTYSQPQRLVDGFYWFRMLSWR